MAQKKITDLSLRSSFDATCNIPVDDTTQTTRVTGQQVSDFLLGNFNTSETLKNVSIAASVAANALTVSVKSQAGTNPSTSDQAFVSFRSSTLASGNYIRRTVNAALSLTVPSTATLGMISGVSGVLYLYAIDSAGTVELAVSQSNFDEGRLATTTAISTGSTSAAVLYSATARTNVAIRLIGRIVITEATAGTWVSLPTEMAVPPFKPLVHVNGTVAGPGGIAISPVISQQQLTTTLTTVTASPVTITTLGRPVRLTLQPFPTSVSALGYMFAGIAENLGISFRKNGTQVMYTCFQNPTASGVTNIIPGFSWTDFSVNQAPGTYTYDIQFKAVNGSTQNVGFNLMQFIAIEEK